MVEKNRVGRRDEDGGWKGELLRVPRAVFGKEVEVERERGREAGERWAGVLISGPRPVRPASAEPLGRLSGMGMGMGYLR